MRTYPVVERDEFVWIWMDDPSLADESKFCRTGGTPTWAGARRPQPCTPTRRTRSIVTFTGDADRWKIYEWHAPSFLHLYTGSAPAGTVLRARTILAEVIAAETRSAEASDAYSGDGDAASAAAVGSVVASAARRA